MLLTTFNSLHAQVYDTTRYDTSSNWAAHPMKGSNDMILNPSYTIVEPDTVTKTYVSISYDTASNFDVFCIYGTVDPTPVNPNDAAIIPIDDPGYKFKAYCAVLGEYSQYAQFGRIYAPYYRQVNMATFNIPDFSASNQIRQAKILDTAVTDVIGAFDFYMKHNNNGKRVILLGHSQGAILLTMMLRKFECDTGHFREYLDKIFLSVLVGMESGPYVIKNTLSGGWLQNIPICVNPLDTACVMSWGTHQYGMTFSSIPNTNHIAENNQLVVMNYMYSSLDTSVHNMKMDPLTYIPPSDVSCSVYPKIFFREPLSDYDVTTDFIGYTNMYTGYIGNPDAANYGLLIERKSVAGDHRSDPLDSASFSDLHIWDMYVSSCDVIDLIW